MKRFVIKRNLPNISKATAAELRATVDASNAALKQLGSDIQWVESFLTDDHSHCIYLARDEDVIREHGKLSGIPVGEISEVRRILTPIG
jgi:hypothetical protein